MSKLPGYNKNHSVPFRDALRIWVKIAVYSFGGPAGQIAVMHKYLVEDKKWISEERFLHALNYCMLLPGPEAQQLATYSGWLLHGIRGGLTAGLLFILPGFVSILILSILYAGFSDLTWVEAMFFGLKAAVLAIVIDAVIKIGRRSLKSSLLLMVAAFSFIGMFVFDVPFPVIIIGAGLAGFLGTRYFSAGRPRTVSPVISETKIPEQTSGKGSHAGDKVIQTLDWRHSIKTLAIWLTIWFAPLIALWLLLGGSHIFVQEGVFFSKTAVLTFGGAYAVLAYLAQQAVENYGWLEPGEMLDGLGMADTTPGPLIQVVQFVGFMGAYRFPGTLDPMVAGIIGSVVATWVTFVPCFLWIFLGAPYIEKLRGNQALGGALKAITAAVVGVILNLALWFALHTLFDDTERFTDLGMNLMYPVLSAVDPGALFIVILAFFMLFYLRIGMMKTLLISVLLGMALFWFVL